MPYSDNSPHDLWLAGNRAGAYDTCMNGTYHNTTMRGAVGLFLACAVAMLGGCVVLKKGPVYVPLHHPNYAIPKLQQPKKSKKSDANVPRAALIQVMEINLPIGKFSQNPKVWKLLTKAPMGPRSAHLLAANGFKTGEGSFKNWKAIRKLIDGPGVTSEAVYCQIANIAPAILTVHAISHSQFLTYHTNEEPLVVRTYRDCVDQFLVAANSNTQYGITVISLEPSVNLNASHTLANPAPGGATPGTGPVRHIFSHLQFSFVLKPQHFVVLAPADINALNTSIGTSFLTQQNHIPRRETVLLLVPLAGR
jgi:hypothetical protein